MLTSLCFNQWSFPSCWQKCSFDFENIFRLWWQYLHFAYHDMVIQSVHALHVNLNFSQTNKQISKLKQIFFFTKIATCVMCWQISLPGGILSLGSGQALITLLGGKTLEYYKNLSICIRIGHSDFFSWWALKIYWVACAQSPATDKMLRTAQNEEKNINFFNQRFRDAVETNSHLFPKIRNGGLP